MLQLNTLQFETNTVCNGKCTFCVYPQLKHRKPMPLYQIADLCMNLAHSAKWVLPFGMQEPLLEPRLAKILSNVKCANARVETAIYSNMSVYPEETWRQIVAWGILDRLFISCYGGTAEKHNEMQPGAPYKVVRRNVKRLMKLKRKLGWTRPEVYFEYLITAETLPYAQKSINKWNSVVDKFVFIRYDSWRGLLPYDEQFEQKVWGNPAPRVPCKELYQNMYIHSNGDVVPCCLDHNGEYVLGNVFQDGWRVWQNSLELKQLRILHEVGAFNEIPLCKNCTKWRYNHPGEWVEKWLKRKVSVPSAISL